MCHFHIMYLPVGALKLNVGSAMLMYAVTHAILVPTYKVITLHLFVEASQMKWKGNKNNDMGACKVMHIHKTMK